MNTLFNKQLREWCLAEAKVYLDELNLTQLEKFRESWKDDALSRKKKQERVSSFFNYCLVHEWISKNPVHVLSKVRVKQKPTLPFSEQEFAALLDTVPLMYMDERGCNGNAKGLRTRLLAMVLLLRWSGLRIRDAVCLERFRLRPADGELLLYMAKTSEPVTVTLPPELTNMLHALPNSNPKYFFWTGNGLPKSAVADWQRVLRRFFKLADLGKRCHPQMFRDTFAVESLVAGVSLEEVSMMLGHGSTKITELHYKPWVRVRQEQLTKAVKKTWSKFSTGK